jgi:hypothetical protein
MEKEFVPYEQALALKELGFDEPCFGYFNTTSHLGIGSFVFKECDKNTFDGYGNKPLLRPTFSQAFRFFREKYELVVDWNHGQHDNFGSYIGVCIKNIHFEETIVGVYKTYEEAELECLKKLIEIVKK